MKNSKNFESCVMQPSALSLACKSYEHLEASDNDRTRFLLFPTWLPSLKLGFGMWECLGSKLTLIDIGKVR